MEQPGSCSASPTVLEARIRRAQANGEIIPEIDAQSLAMRLHQWGVRLDGSPSQVGTSPTTVTVPPRSAAPACEQTVPRPDIVPPLALLSTTPSQRKRGSVSFADTARAALHSLGANKLRSMLTMLGIIIGVAAVVTLLGVGNGVLGFVRAELEQNGTNLIYIQGAAQTVNGVATANTSISLTVDDAKALAEPGAVPDAVAVSPEEQRGGQITAGDANAYVSVFGVWPEYTIVHDYAVARGDFVSASDNTAVLGSTVATVLFGDADPVGRSVRILGKGFLVIGVMQAKGGVGGTAFDRQVYVPLAAVYQLVGSGDGGRTVTNGKTVRAISMKGTSLETMDAAVAEVQGVLDVRHHILTAERRDYQVETEADLLKTIKQTLAIIKLFLALVAGISLLVGGIGIMNIMLMSVTVRTPEIGIRKAVGARARDILQQFIVEAVLLSLFGALIGAAIAVGVTTIIGTLWYPSPVSARAIIGAITFAMVIGLFFGLYPARRAARLQPIEAVRYE